MSNRFPCKLLLGSVFTAALLAVSGCGKAKEGEKDQGVRGTVRVESLTDFPDRFEVGRQVTIAGRRLTISGSQESEGSLLLTFAEIKDREKASELRGAYMEVPLDQARTLPTGRYYHFQLVGLTVLRSQNHRALGRVEEGLNYPANDVLRVVGTGGELLVPMISSVVLKVDLPSREIVIDLPEATEA